MLDKISDFRKFPVFPKITFTEDHYHYCYCWKTYSSSCTYWKQLCSVPARLGKIGNKYKPDLKTARVCWRKFKSDSDTTSDSHYQLITCFISVILLTNKHWIFTNIYACYCENQNYLISWYFIDFLWISILWQ